eukprot:GHRQ01033989.1.p1 GENE.GHRQ01033989.1~~GHRQ01033989.1.p1  ORF type:complete len:118 (-),score=12.59 GHRQ01033989.1:311-664(-)
MLTCRQVSNTQQVLDSILQVAHGLSCAHILSKPQLSPDVKPPLRASRSLRHVLKPLEPWRHQPRILLRVCVDDAGVQLHCCQQRVAVAGVDVLVLLPGVLGNLHETAQAEGGVVDVA